MTSLASIPTALRPLSDFGTFTWSVVEDLTFGDSVLAKFDEIPEMAFAEGVPVEVILERITEGDGEKMASEIHEAILSGNAAASRYTVDLPSGESRALASFGRGFRDECGVPSYFSGAVTIASTSRVVVGANPLESHCRAAFDLANTQGKQLTARYLSSALGSLGSSHAPPC